MMSADTCTRFYDCEGCSHCSEAPRRCEYCADPWDECLCDFKSLPEPHECEQHDIGEECERCADLFTACAECGAFGISVDSEGMAAELCEACENPPAVQVVTALSILYTDPARFTPEELRTIAEAVALLRTHAVPDSHPWAIS